MEALIETLKSIIDRVESISLLNEIAHNKRRRILCVEDFSDSSVPKERIKKIVEDIKWSLRFIVDDIDNEVEGHSNSILEKQKKRDAAFFASRQTLESLCNNQGEGM